MLQKIYKLVQKLKILKFFKKDRIVTIGCEPANNLKDELKKNCDYMINDFWHTKHLKKIPNKFQKLKVVSYVKWFVAYIRFILFSRNKKFKINKYLIKS